MTKLERRTEDVKDVLERAVAEALEKKRRLGQYAVIYENGRPVRIESDQLPRKEQR